MKRTPGRRSTRRPARRSAFCASAFLVGVTVAANLAGASRTARAAHSAQPSTPVVRVTVGDSSVSLAPKRVPVGPVRFRVVNRGARPQTLTVGGRKTPVLRPGGHAELAVRFRRTGKHALLATVPGDASRGLHGTIVALERGIVLRRVAKVPGAAVHLAAPPDDVRRLFVVEKQGAIRVVLDGKLLARPFLDLTARVRSAGNEQGLLSIAFAPDYATTRRFYVYYVDEAENARVVEFRRSAARPNVADRATGRNVLVVQQPSGEHYGGLLHFGPDGYLYLGIGDGGLFREREPQRAQWGNELHGKLLRIDPHASAGRPYSIPRSNPFVRRAGWRGEIWAVGLRNPWRYWIDPVTRGLYVGDPGEYVIESIDYAPRGQAPGANFGWPCLEGTLRHQEYALSSCPRALMPIYEYARADGNCAVIGGVVVRDPRLPAHAGDYLFSDFCRGDIRRLRSLEKPTVRSLGIGKEGLTSFGVDARGRVYVTVFYGGLVYRLDPKLR
jgi:glucose/arabinose dehydrogenase